MLYNLMEVTISGYKVLRIVEAVNAKIYLQSSTFLNAISNEKIVVEGSFKRRLQKGST